MPHSTHAYAPDPRNDAILIDINGELFPRAEAKVSVFDSGFVLGDGVWEGLRVHPGPDGKGVIAFLDRHMKRLWDGAKTLDFNMGVSKDDLKARLYNCLDANEAHDGVHIRLMVSRGVKATPYQDPRATITPPTIVIIPEFKRPLTETESAGKRLFTVHVRRGYPDVQDQKLNSHSKLNCIFACIQAAKAGADEALMLDPHGFVATCNSTGSCGHRGIRGVGLGRLAAASPGMGRIARNRDLGQCGGRPDGFVERVESDRSERRRRPGRPQPGARTPSARTLRGRNRGSRGNVGPANGRTRSTHPKSQRRPRNLP